jgi:hypothetical protein
MRSTSRDSRAQSPRGQSRHLSFANQSRINGRPSRAPLGKSPKTLAAIAAAIALIDNTTQLKATTVTSTWKGTSSTAWTTAANWSPSSNYPNNGNGGVSDYNVVIPSTSNQPIISPNGTSSSTMTVDQLTLNSSATLSIQGNADLTLNAASVVDNGNIIVNSTTMSYSTLTFGGAGSTLSGTGAITLGGRSAGDNSYQTAEIVGTLTVGSNNTISGIGGIVGVFTNNGTIDANIASGTIYFGNATNNKLIEATNGGGVSLQEVSLTQGSGGDLLAAGSSSSVNIQSCTVTGGTIGTSSGGVIIVENLIAPTVFANVTNNGTLDVGFGSQLNVTGNLVDNGSISATPAGNAPATITFAGGTLSGSGTLHLTAGTFQIALTGTLTQAAGHTIDGGGTLNTSSGTITATVTNQGVINANNSSSPLIFSGGYSLNNTGGVLSATSNATVELSSVTISGGTLSTSSGVIETINSHSNTLSGVTNAGTLNITGGSDLNISGNLIDNGSIVVDSNNAGNSSLTFAGGIVSGTGTIALAGSGAFLKGTLTQSAGHTISGFGTISASLTNNGLIAGSSTQTLYFTGGTITNSSTIGSTFASLAFSGGVVVNNTAGVIDGSVNLSTATITGGTLGNSVDYDFTQSSSSTTLNGITFAATLYVVTGSSVITTATTTNNGSIVIEGGTLTADGTLAGTGTVQVNTGSVLTCASSIGTSTQGALMISGGRLDLNNNAFRVTYGTGADPISSIAAWIASGYNNGTWNGPGIDSSTAAVTAGYAVGYADSADPGNPAGLSSGQIEIKYTLLGDADLNGTVNGIDFGILAANFNKAVSRWDQGDFDYNNIVNGLDFTALAANFNKAASGASVGDSALSDPALVAFAEANGLMADVPEPMTGLMTALAGFGILCRRRRSRITPARRN